MDNILYADLESILDVRSGILLNQGYDEKEVLEYLSSAEFNKRTVDDFSPFLSAEDYQRILKEGDYTNLIRARPTYLLGCIYSDIVSMENKSAAVERIVPVTVWVNIYPFKLTEEEITMLQAIVFTALRGDNMVYILNLPPEELTPEMIKTNNIKSIYMYNFTDWLNANGQSMMEINIKETRFHFSPTIKNKPTQQQLEILKESQIGDIFTTWDLGLSTFLSFNHLITPLYSETSRGIKYVNEATDALTEDITEHSKDIDIDEEDFDGYIGGHI